jgi:uncharacterized protein
MQIHILTLGFMLPGCRSLKEKRQRMGGLHERFGRQPAVAVIESGFRDSHNQAEWSFVLVGETHRDLAALSSETERRALSVVDAELVQVDRAEL